MSLESILLLLSLAIIVSFICGMIYGIRIGKSEAEHIMRLQSELLDAREQLKRGTSSGGPR